MKRVAIIGGGISGLSAALHLDKARAAGAELSYTVFESSRRWGGSLRSDRVEGCLVEAGPDSFLTEKPWALALCKELGLEDQVIGSNDSQRKTYIVVKNRLVALPDGLMLVVPTKLFPIARSPLFSWRTKLRMAGELLHPPRSADHDETVAELVERHFGVQVVERLADPLLAGVYGGHANMLSARAVLPRFVEMEEKFGSLSRAMLAARDTSGAEAGRPRRPIFSSLKNGMQALVDALTGRLDPASLRLGSAVRGIYRENDLWRVAIEMGSSEAFDAVIVATPANVAGAILEAVDRELADDLLKVTYSSSVTVTLGYHADQLRGLPPGFGFLVPRSEGRRMLACTFVHNKFPHRAPPGKGVLRCFLGGALDEAVLNLSDNEIVAKVRSDLREIAKLDVRPMFQRIYRWRGAMAQYEPGHIQRVRRIRSHVEQLAGLELAGNAYHGVGVPDCIREGINAANRVAQAAAAAISR